MSGGTRDIDFVVPIVFNYVVYNQYGFFVRNYRIHEIVAFEIYKFENNGMKFNLLKRDFHS